jgi:hypothetical protein
MKIVIILIAVLLTSCTAATVDVSECVKETPDNFWDGLWHGVICPISFFVSLFSDSVAIYSSNNNGGWYDFGFVIGAGILFSGSSSASRR